MKPFHSIFVVFMAVVLLLQSVSKTLVVVYWKANQSWIAQNLCEKRFEKKSCCEGSCQLKKWTADEKTDASTQPTPLPDLKNLKEMDSFFEAKPDFQFAFFSEFEIRFSFVLKNERLPVAPFLEALGQPPDAPIG